MSVWTLAEPHRDSAAPARSSGRRADMTGRVISLLARRAAPQEPEKDCDGPHRPSRARS